MMQPAATGMRRPPPCPALRSGRHLTRAIRTQDTAAVGNGEDEACEEEEGEDDDDGDKEEDEGAEDAWGLRGARELRLRPRAPQPRPLRAPAPPPPLPGGVGEARRALIGQCGGVGDSEPANGSAVRGAGAPGDVRGCPTVSGDVRQCPGIGDVRGCPAMFRDVRQCPAMSDNI